MNEKNEVAYFEQATSLLNDAERYSQTDMSLLLRKGLLLLAQRKIPQAEYQLKIAVSREPDNVAAHVALVGYKGLALIRTFVGLWSISSWGMEEFTLRVSNRLEKASIQFGKCTSSYWSLSLTTGE